MPSPSRRPAPRASPVHPFPPSAPELPLQEGSPPSPTAIPVRPVVSNTTPLITLAELGLLDVLRQLYDVVCVPPSVLAEYQYGRTAHPERPDLQAVPWMVVQPAPVDALLPATLDVGERDAIALARGLEASRILLDERAARAVAARLKLKVTGSAGVLLAARQLGLISAVRPYLDRMLAQGRYVSPRLYEQVLQQAGEESK